MTNPAHLWELMRSEPTIALNMMHILTDRIRRNNVAMLENLKQQAQLRVVTTIDSMTGLHNRRWMNEMFLRQIDRCAREKQPLALAMIDVDHFKRVNDGYGHQAGDQVLMEISRIMQHHFRPSDLLARYGGEEFCVLLPDAALDDAVAALERFRASVEKKPMALAQRAAMFVSVSAGVARWRDGQSLDDLINAADRALYRAKSNGRNQVMSAVE